MHNYNIHPLRFGGIHTAMSQIEGLKEKICTKFSDNTFQYKEPEINFILLDKGFIEFFINEISELIKNLGNYYKKDMDIFFLNVSIQCILSIPPNYRFFKIDFDSRDQFLNISYFTEKTFLSFFN